ncbi:putative ubiquitin-like-specific protease 2B [Citrus sinensis]|nr:putative ubiquitin-like-specific protease 2B [Citrus sinensis]
MKSELGVFDFKEEDELPELEAGKFLGKFKNPNNDDSPALKLTKETIVQIEGIGNVPCVNADAVDCTPSCNVDCAPSCNEQMCAPMKIDGEEGNDIRAPQMNSTSCEQSPNLEKDNCGFESCISELASRDLCTKGPLLGESQLCSGNLDPPSNNEPVDVNSDADGSMSEGSSSSPASDIAPNGVSLNGHMSDQWVDDSEVDDINMGVVVSPDYVFFRDKFCLGYLVVFSCTGIKIKDSNACGVQESFTFEKGIDDIVDIKFQWLQRFGSVEVKLHVILNDVAQDDNACGTSGIEELKFSFSDCNWSEQLEKITSLNAKYLALWSVDHDNPVDMDGVGRRRYFPNFDEPFEDVVYPEGDSDAVSISKRDIDLLQPDTFVNDTIIDFYIKYLKNQIQAEEKHRFHFFNSFFFRKLADLDKDPSSISDGKAAFLRVRKWTRKVDIFGKDYIFIPVNFNLHWSLIVICHPGDVASFKVEDLKRSEKVPCILHMDSIKGTHAGLKKLVQSYLCEEWKERHKDTSEDVSSKFLNFRFIPLELPQQENSFDCGLFLLHYLELFLAEAPVSFSPLKLKKLSSFLNVDWFPPGEASLKRSLIQKLISELLQNRSRVCLEEHQSSRFLENSVNEMRLEFLSEKCSAAAARHGNLSNSQAGQGVEITLLGPTSGRNLQCANDSSLVLKELLEPGVTAGSLLAYQSFGEPSSYYDLNGAASAREHDVETAEEYGYLASGSNGFQQITELTPQVGSISFPSRDFGTEATWNPEICMQGEHGVDSSDLSASDDSEDVGIIENGPFVEDGGQSLEGRTDQPRSLSMDIGCFTEGPASVPSEMLQTLAVGGPEVPDQMHDRNDITDLPSCHENPTTSFLEDSNLIEQRLSQDSDTIGNREVDGDYAQVTDDNLQTQPYEQQGAKRLRLTPREGED